MSYSRYLRGLTPDNNHMVHQRGLKGSTYGAASRVRHFSVAEKKKMEEELRAKGYLRPSRKK